MTGTQLLDAAIGVVFVILSFSLIASALSEALATVLNWRGRMLRRGLFRLLEGDAGADLIDRVFPGATRIGRARLTLDLLGDPAIRVLHGPRGALSILWDRLTGGHLNNAGREAARLGRLPSAIPADSFARALVDTLARRIDLTAVAMADAAAATGEGRAAGRPADAAAVQALVQLLEAEAGRAMRAEAGPLGRIALSPDLKTRLADAVAALSAAREVRRRLDLSDDATSEVRACLAALIGSAETRMQGILGDLGAWFDTSMERVSGWYVRRSRLSLFVLGVALAASVNVNLAGLGGRILHDPAVRDALVERAEGRLGAGLPPVRPDRRVETVEDLTAELGAAHERLTALPGHGGAGFGWSCAGDRTWTACLADGVRLGAVISWLLIGLGCMMGGRFWYDFLGSVMRFRPAAAVARQVS